MKRNEWVFSKSSGELLVAAKKQLEKHQGKQKWWEEKKAETMKKVGEGGIRVHDSLASNYSNTKGGYGPTIEVEDGLQRDLSEAQTKIMSHHKLCVEYNGWIAVFEGNPGMHLELHHDDYLYFFSQE